MGRLPWWVRPLDFAIAVLWSACTAVLWRGGWPSRAYPPEAPPSLPRLQDLLFGQRGATTKP